LAQRLRKNDIVLKVSPEALEWLSEKGYDPQFGARPVKRVLQKDVLNSLSKHLLSGTIDKSAPVVLDMFEGTLVFRKEIEGEKIEEA
jgi:ATP-dependent Clp protease ATP-binding subunit ClpB